MKKHEFANQKGQAIVELCVCLIPILVILLGMIFIAGLGISNIKTFIQAKANAEILSRSNSVVGGDGQTIHHWDYGQPEYGGDGYAFTADDRIVDFAESGTSFETRAQVDSSLNNQSWSESISGNERVNYTFMPLSALPGTADNFSQDIPATMLAAAELVSGTADSDLSKVFTIEESDYFSPHEIRSFNFAFGQLFGIEVDDIDLHRMQANTVYYPLIKTNE
jgi:hypothetical protein